MRSSAPGPPTGQPEAAFYRLQPPGRRVRRTQLCARFASPYLLLYLLVPHGQSPAVQCQPSSQPAGGHACRGEFTRGGQIVVGLAPRLAESVRSQQCEITGAMKTLDHLRVDSAVSIDICGGRRDPRNQRSDRFEHRRGRTLAHGCAFRATILNTICSRPGR